MASKRMMHDHHEIDHFYISTSVAQIELGLDLVDSQSLSLLFSFLKFRSLVIHRSIQLFGHKSNC